MNPFDRAAPLLERALNALPRPLWTLDDVRAEVSAGNATLWSGERSALVSTLERHDSVNEVLMEFWLGAGDLKEITGAIPYLEARAREAGVTQIQVQGRRGWERALKPYGYEAYVTTTRKLLTQ